MPSTLEQARAAKPKALQVFRRLASVVDVGITRMGESYALKVNLKELPPKDAKLPDHVSGVPVQIEVVGTIRAR